MELISTFAPIEKTTDQDDGSLLVYGKATDGGLDLDDQRCDPTWLSSAMPEWFSSAGNIRAQHRADSAVGKATEHTFDADGHYITARIVDREAIAKTKAGVFTGFSIGIRRPKIVKSPTAPNGLINGGTITEVSLCDRPANPACTLMLCKSMDNALGWSGSPGDVDEDRGLVRCEELVVKTVTTKDEALKAAQETLELVEGAPDEVTIEFDREAAKTLVTETLAKKALGQSEAGDISGADSAIASIAQLIISEAKDLAKMPSQDCDIHLLMSAVDALRCFARREAMEQAGDDPDVHLLAAEADALKGKYSAEQLQTMLSDGKAMKNPNGEPSYPIGDAADLKNAIHAVGRGSGDHDAIRAHIKKRAAALGKSDMIPDNWKTVAPTTTKAENVSDTKVILDGQDMKVVPAEAPDAAKAAGADDATPVETPDAPDVEKSDTPEVVEPAGEEPVTKAADAAPTDPDVLVKAFSGALSEDGSLLVKAFSDAFDEAESPLMKALTGALAKEGSPLSKMIAGIVEASAETTAKSLDSFGERLVQVEAMATPGGPALRRTESERNQARKSDLALEARRFKMMATSTEDPDLRRGYATKAAQLEAEYKAIA